MTRHYRIGPQHAQRRERWWDIPGVLALCVGAGFLVGGSGAYVLFFLLVHGEWPW